MMGKPSLDLGMNSRLASAFEPAVSSERETFNEFDGQFGMGKVEQRRRPNHHTIFGGATALGAIEITCDEGRFYDYEAKYAPGGSEQFMHVTGEPDGPPARFGLSVVDISVANASAASGVSRCSDDRNCHWSP